MALALVAGMAAGCFSTHVINEPLPRVDPSHGYRLTNASEFRDPGEISLYVAFSGGGTRAAALAYGVLEALRDTAIVVDGEPVRLLDEIDTLSGVSGGSFPAAYYGLFGDRIFEEFEPRFLRRNIQRTIIGHTLLPWNLVGLMTPWLSRSDIAKRIYDETVFDSATFEDLTSARGPRVLVNATDLSSGERFVFNQGYFDLICSDLAPFPIAYAVAASSAVPALLSPVSLRSYAGSCGYQLPELLNAALGTRRSDPRRYRAVVGVAAFADSGKRYLHLIDGGISDNLGLRAGLDMVSAAGGLRELSHAAHREIPAHMVIISVNAQTAPPHKLDLSAAAPSFAALMNAVSGSQIRRYNFETLILAHEAMENWVKTANEGRPPDARTRAHVIEISFDNLEDPEERHALKTLPTSFTLSDEQVDRLRDAGRRLLVDSPDYQDLLRALR